MIKLPVGWVDRVELNKLFEQLNVISVESVADTDADGLVDFIVIKNSGEVREFSNLNYYDSQTFVE